MEEKRLASAFLIGIIILGAIVIWAVNSVKLWEGYGSAGSIKTLLESVDIVILLANLALLLFLVWVSLKAYDRVKTTNFYLLMLAFSLFTIKIVVKMGDLYFIPGEFLLFDPIENLFELGILLLLFAALFRK